MKNVISYLVLSSLFLLSMASVFAQDTPIVSWTFDSNALTNGEYILNFRAKIQKGWYLYSQHIESMPPLPTTISFDNPSEFKLIGGIDERGTLIDEYDEALEKKVKKYAKIVTFQATVKTHKPLTEITGGIEFMTCDHEKCMPPQVNKFYFKLIGSSQSIPAFASNAVSSITRSPNYNHEAAIIPESEINMPPPAPLELLSSKSTSPRDYSLEREQRYLSHSVSNAERTSILEDGDEMVAANIMKFVKRGQKTNKEDGQLATKQKEYRRLAEENTKHQAEEAEKIRQKAEAETMEPVRWTFDMRSLGEGVYALVGTATIAENWRVYSANNTGDAPFALRVEFQDNQRVEWLDTQAQEIGQVIASFDPVFEKETNSYAQTFSFERKVKFKENTQIMGTVSYMSANQVAYKMPQEVPFLFNKSMDVVLPVQKNNAGWWWVLGAVVVGALGIGYVAGLFGGGKKKTNL